ncbi:hypothetical protein GZL_04550 [Streptomyces sp. 769]|nr:hypothetical protein GZL_04550 [Streptomyces sp. 769]
MYGVMRCLVHAVTRAPRVVIEREGPPGRTTRPATTARPDRSTTPHQPGAVQPQLRTACTNDVQAHRHAVRRT